MGKGDPKTVKASYILKTKAMIECSRLFSLAIVLICLSMQNVYAQDNDVFRITGVEVDVTAPSAIAARRIALDQGQREAFHQLFQRLVAEDDWLAEPNLPNEDLADLILGFDIHDERTSSTRYLATLDVSFAPERVRRLLGSLNVAFAETRTRPFLVLPVLHYAGVDTLWGQYNPWADAWRQDPVAGSLIRYVLPDNDIQDRVLLNVQDVIVPDIERIEGLITRYNAEDILIADAHLAHSGLDGRASLRVELKQGLDIEPAFEILVNQQAGEDLNNMLARGVKRLDALLLQDWKKRVLIQYGSQETLSAYVEFDDFETWRHVIDGLNAIPQVRNLNVERLTFDHGDIRFEFYGGLDQLQVAMAELSLFLAPQMDDHWLITDDEQRAIAAKEEMERQKAQRLLQPLPDISSVNEPVEGR